MVCQIYDTPFCTCLSVVKLICFCYFLIGVHPTGNRFFDFVTIIQNMLDALQIRRQHMRNERMSAEEQAGRRHSKIPLTVCCRPSSLLMIFSL